MYIFTFTPFAPLTSWIQFIMKSCQSYLQNRSRCLSASDSTLHSGWACALFWLLGFAVGVGLCLVLAVGGCSRGGPVPTSDQADPCRYGGHAFQSYLLLPHRYREGCWNEGATRPSVQAVWIPKFQGVQLPRKASQLGSGRLPSRVQTLFHKAPAGWVSSHRVPLSPG